MQRQALGAHTCSGSPLCGAYQRLQRAAALARCTPRALASCPSLPLPATGCSTAGTAPEQPCSSHQTAQHSQRQQQPSPLRRAALAAAAAAAASALALGAPAPPALAAPAPPAAPTGSCQLQQAGSGLQWCDIEEGDGPASIKGAFYKVNYRATLGRSGVEFDNSWAKRQPLIIKIGDREVMDAWDAAILGEEGVPPMREGGVRRIVVPPGPLQTQGTKSLVWVAGLLEALDEAGESAGQSDLAFDLELIKRRARS